MNKILLIIQREFLTRVRKRTFIIGTILFPLLYLGLIFGTGYIADKTKENLHIALIDKSGLFSEDLIKSVKGDDTLNTIKLVPGDAKGFIENFDSMGYDGYVIIPENFKWETGSMAPLPKDFFVFTIILLLSSPVSHLKFSGIIT